MADKKLPRKILFGKRRYWYHVSSTLNKKEEYLIPWDEDRGFNRGGYEPEGERICVAPSIEQCITAIPYTLTNKLTIYRTKSPVKANPPKDVFDSKITQEGWLLKPTMFVKIGKIDFNDILLEDDDGNVISEAASVSEPRYSGRVLQWWKRRKIRKFIERP
jgi:hypothetical protein